MSTEGDTLGLAVGTAVNAAALANPGGIDHASLFKALGNALFDNFAPNKIDVESGAAHVVLLIGDVPDGTYLARSGTTLIGTTAISVGPTGAASGDLSATFPGPTVVAFHETSGPTRLAFGSIPDGTFIQRSGTTAVGVGFGSTAGTICQGDDSRLSDTRVPTGAAGGDLGSTFPNPTALALHETGGPTRLAYAAIADGTFFQRSGTSVVGTAFGTAAGTICQGNDSRLSDSRAPTGAAGGDLGSTYPNPTVTAIHETGGPTKLTFGSIADGQIFKRSGSTAVGVAYSPLTTKGDLYTYSTAEARLAVGANSLPLVADSTQTTGLKWAALTIAGGGTGQTTQTAAFDALSPLTTKGDHLVFDGTHNVRLGVGANSLPLVADSTQTSGIKWAALTIAGGGTGQTAQTAAFDALSPLTTKGDIPVFDGTHNVRLAVGSNTQVLTADSTQTTGVKWAAAGGGSITGSGTANQITFWSGTSALTGSTRLVVVDADSSTGPAIKVLSTSSSGRCILGVQNTAGALGNVTGLSMTSYGTQPFASANNEIAWVSSTLWIGQTAGIGSASGGNPGLVIDGAGRLVVGAAGNYSVDTAYSLIVRGAGGGSGVGLFIKPPGNGDLTANLTMGDGQSVAVGSASTGRLRYNDSTHTLQLSLNAGAYNEVATASPSDGFNFAFGTTTGTKLGTSATQKLGFWGVTAVVQQVLATGASHTVDDVISFLQTVGLCKQV